MVAFAGFELRASFQKPSLVASDVASGSCRAYVEGDVRGE